jgi:hypothetical protein
MQRISFLDHAGESLYVQRLGDVGDLITVGGSLVGLSDCSRSDHRRQHGSQKKSFHELKLLTKIRSGLGKSENPFQDLFRTFQW